MVCPRVSCWIETTPRPPTWPANVTVPEAHAYTGDPPGYVRVTPRLPGSQSWTGGANEEATGTGDSVGHCQRSRRCADPAGAHMTRKRQYDRETRRTVRSRRRQQRNEFISPPCAHRTYRTTQTSEPVDRPRHVWTPVDNDPHPPPTARD